MSTARPVIAHVLHRLDRAGAEVLAAGLARSLQDRYDSVFFCLDGFGPLADELRNDGFVVEAMDRQPGIDRAMARRLRKRFTDHAVSLVHAHQYTPFFYSSLARGFGPGRGRRLPILFTEHGRHYPDHRSAKRVLANKLLLSSQDRVSAVGGFVRDALIKNEGIAGSRIEVIYNGIKPSDVPSADHRAQARRLLGLDSAGPVIMQVARFHPVKDHGTGLRGFAAAVKHVPQARLVLVGDGSERAAAEELTQNLGLSDRVVFTGVRSDVRQLLPAADVFLLSSLSEGISVTLLEAMDACLPIVATDVGGNGEVVKHQKTGLLAPREGHQAIGQHLFRLLLDGEQAKAFGAAGHARLLNRFTQDQMHAGYQRVYKTMI